MKAIKINMDAGVNEVTVKCVATIYVRKSDFPSTLFSYLSSGVEVPHFTTATLSPVTPCPLCLPIQKPQCFRCSQDLVWCN